MDCLFNDSEPEDASIHLLCCTVRNTTLLYMYKYWTKIKKIENNIIGM